MKNAVITEWDVKEGKVNFSIKEATRHPFEGIEVRHPIGCTRMATIVSKWKGGVYCRLYDGATDILCTYDAMAYDGDFKIDDRVELLVKKFNFEKKLVFGKILRRMY